MDKSKVRPVEMPMADGLPPDILISPGTRRARRLPPGKNCRKKWPVLDASGPPAIDLQRWRLGRFSQDAQGEGLRRLSLCYALVAAGQRLGRRLYPRVIAAGGRPLPEAA
jgi:hypothetical protein